MNKKILFILLSFVLIVPCFSLLSGCGDNVIFVEKVEATCISEGLKSHYKKNNNELYIDKECKFKVSRQELIISKIVLTKVNNKESTCTQHGIKEHYKCPKCGKLYKTNKASKETEVTKQDLMLDTLSLIKIDKVEPTCTKSGVREYYKCLKCNKIYKTNIANKENEITAQDLKLDVIKLEKIETLQPTYTDFGVKEHYRCPKCGKLYKTNKASKENEVNVEDLKIDKLVVSYTSSSIIKTPTKDSEGTLKVYLSDGTSENLVLPKLSVIDKYTVVNDEVPTKNRDSFTKYYFNNSSFTPSEKITNEVLKQLILDNKNTYFKTIDKTALNTKAIIKSIVKSEQETKLTINIIYGKLNTNDILDLYTNDTKINITVESISKDNQILTCAKNDDGTVDIIVDNNILLDTVKKGDIITTKNYNIESASKYIVTIKTFDTVVMNGFKKQCSYNDLILCDISIVLPLQAMLIPNETYEDMDVILTQKCHFENGEKIYFVDGEKVYLECTITSVVK